MITGVVTSDAEAVITLTVQGIGSQTRDVEAVIDTGFNGSLTLPPDVIAALGLTWLSRGRALLGDGRIEEFDVYSGRVNWDGRLVRVIIDCADTEALVGMALMTGYDIAIRDLPGGRVTLRKVTARGPATSTP